MQINYFTLRVVRGSFEGNLMITIIRLSRACFLRSHELCVRETPQGMRAKKTHPAYTLFFG